MNALFAVYIALVLIMVSHLLYSRIPVWTQPVAMVILIVMVLYQVFRNKD